MNTTKTHLTSTDATKVMERYCALNPYARGLMLQAQQLGHHSATLLIQPSRELKASSGGIDAGVLMGAINVAASLIAESSVPSTRTWVLKSFSLELIASELRGCLRLIAKSDELDWNTPGDKLVTVCVALDSREEVDTCAIGEAVISVLG